MHVNVLITRRTDWKSPGRNWMSHQVVFIIISLCYKRPLLAFIRHQYIIHDSARFIGIWRYWSKCQVEWFYFIFNYLHSRLLVQALQTQMSWREIQNAATSACSTAIFDLNHVSCYPRSQKPCEIMFMCVCVWGGIQTYLPCFPLINISPSSPREAFPISTHETHGIVFHNGIS